ncbi:MAG: hypothetical protein AABZ55_04480 [Bdellovibrionota bacterium]
MSTSISKHLNSRQLIGLRKIGDILAPGDGEFPSFSNLACEREVDRVLDCMPMQDVSDLKMLLSVVSFVPFFWLKWKLHAVEWMWERGIPIGSLGRMIRLGFRGLVYSLYYSGGKPYEVMGYNVGVYLGDQKKH